MTRDEWNAYIAVAPATPYQRGRIMAECSRLGIGDRAERLAICARIAGLGELDSTRDLVWGDAGRIVRVLLDLGDVDELHAAAGIPDEDRAEAAEIDPGNSEDQADEPRPAMTLVEAIKTLIIQLHAIFTTARRTTP